MKLKQALNELKIDKFAAHYKRNPDRFKDDPVQLIGTIQTQDGRDYDDAETLKQDLKKFGLKPDEDEQLDKIIHSGILQVKNKEFAPDYDPKYAHRNKHLRPKNPLPSKS